MEHNYTYELRKESWVDQLQIFQVLSILARQTLFGVSSFYMLCFLWLFSSNVCDSNDNMARNIVLELDLTKDIPCPSCRNTYMYFDFNPLIQNKSTGIK